MLNEIDAGRHIQFPDWYRRVQNVLLQDKGWEYYHQGEVKFHGTSEWFMPIVHSYRHVVYFFSSAYTVSIQIPPILKRVDKRLDEINSGYEVGKVVSIGLFESYSALRMAIYYNGKYSIQKIESPFNELPDVPELTHRPFPEGREEYVDNSHTVRHHLVTKYMARCKI